LNLNEEVFNNSFQYDTKESLAKLEDFEKQIKKFFETVGNKSPIKEKKQEGFIRNSVKDAKIGNKLFGNSLNNSGEGIGKSNSLIGNQPQPNQLMRSVDLHELKAGENKDLQSILLLNDSSETQDVQHKLEAKLNRLQQELGKRVHKECQLQDKVKKQNIEIDGLKKLLNNNHFYTDLKGSISNISEAIFNSSKDLKLKGNHQILLKSLLEDSVSFKVDNLEQKVANLNENIHNLRHKMKEEIKRSHESIGLSRKYISAITTSNRMLKDFVDIGDFLENSTLEAEEDLLKIEEMQLQSTQNNIMVRSLSIEDLTSMRNNPTKVLQQALMEKEKHINRLEHELQIMSKSKRRAASKYRKLRSGSKHLGDDFLKEEIDRKSAFSTRQIPNIPGLLEKSRANNLDIRETPQHSASG